MCVYAAIAAAKLLQSCLTLCNPIDGSPPGSPVTGILQAGTLEWVAISFSTAAAAKSLQSCPTLCDPVDGSPPGSPVPGIPTPVFWPREFHGLHGVAKSRTRLSNFHFHTKNYLKPMCYSLLRT